MKKRRLLITATRRTVSFYLGTEGDSAAVAKVTAALLGKRPPRRSLKQYDNVVMIERKVLWNVHKGCVIAAASLKDGYEFAGTCAVCGPVRAQVLAILRKRNVLKKAIVL